MSPFSEMISKFNFQNNNKIKKFCSPLYNHFKVNHFWYHSISDQGFFTCLGSNAAWMEYYFSENLYLPNPYIRSPKNYSTGINFIRKIEDQTYQKSVDIGVRKFNLDQNLLFLKRTKNGVKGFGFASYGSRNEFETLCMNELPLLKLFIKRFEEEFEPLIKKMERNPVEIAKLIGPAFHQKNSSIQLPQISKSSFLDELQFKEITLLTQREKSVLYYVSKGYSAAETAAYLCLSKRTVEHYLENIKNKLNCFSKAELIQSIQEFIHLGYFVP